MYRGARIAPTGVQNYTTISADDALRFAVSQYDTDGLWSEASPNRLTIPAGVSKVRLRLAVQVDASDSIPGTNAFRFRKNGVMYFPGSVSSTVVAATYNNAGTFLVSDVIDVVAGDYFEAVYYVSATFSLNNSRGETWFAIEIVEITDSTAYRTTDLLDVETTPPTDGQVLVFDGGAGKYVPGTPSVTVPEGSSIYKPFRGAMAARTTTTGALTSPYYPVIWQTTAYDTDAFWSAGTPGRLTIPIGSGIKKVRLAGCIDPNGTVFSGNQHLRIYKNGSINFLGTLPSGFVTGYTDAPTSCATAVIEVAEGDYFELGYLTADPSFSIKADRSSFSIEVVEAEEPIP